MQPTNAAAARRGVATILHKWFLSKIGRQLSCQGWLVACRSAFQPSSQLLRYGCPSHVDWNSFYAVCPSANHQWHCQWDRLGQTIDTHFTKEKIHIGWFVPFTRSCLKNKRIRKELGQHIEDAGLENLQLLAYGILTDSTTEFLMDSTQGFWRNYSIGSQFILTEH